MRKTLVGLVWFSVINSAAPFCWSADGLCVVNAREASNGPTGSAPFCVRTSASVNCWYYSASECRRAARSADGACFPNPRR
jgi:hypothetical protein